MRVARALLPVIHKCKYTTIFYTHSIAHMFIHYKFIIVTITKNKFTYNESKPEPPNINCKEFISINV